MMEREIRDLMREYQMQADVNRGCVRPRRGSKDPHNLFNRGAASALDEVVDDLALLVDPDLCTQPCHNTTEEEDLVVSWDVSALTFYQRLRLMMFVVVGRPFRISMCKMRITKEVTQ